MTNQGFGFVLMYREKTIYLRNSRCPFAVDTIRICLFKYRFFCLDGERIVALVKNARLFFKILRRRIFSLVRRVFYISANKYIISTHKYHF